MMIFEKFFFFYKLENKNRNNVLAFFFFFCKLENKNRNDVLAFLNSC